MASLANLTIAQQATTLLSNLRRDIRQIATDIKGRLDRSEWTAGFAASSANSAGTRFVALLQKVADHQAVVEAALLEWSVSVDDTRADYQLLRTASEAMRDATAGNVSTTLTQILSQVSEQTRLF